tara:strand:+ start:470 stop:1078 length:609 start_codon:yes stop_codon:yes gene_type:complete
MTKKNILQLVLIILLVILSGIFYQKYMVSYNTSDKVSKKNDPNKTIDENLILKENKETANIIENLKYTSEDLFGNTYIINARSAQVKEGKIDQVKLFEVTAKIIPKDDEVIYINSDFADYNKINNNTIFKKNVNVTYGDQSIDAELINLDFSKNLIKIEEDVYYRNNNLKVNADKVEIDIKSRKSKISMKKIGDKVKIFAKY